MRKLLLAVGLTAVLAVSSCGSKDSENAGAFPASFKTMSDSERMAYMMRKADPDSVARFLCYASLGKVPGAQIDTLGTAYLYAIETYRGDDSEKFGVAFEMVMKNLSLADKMHTQFKLGLSDTLSIGYDLGLGYVGTIRSKQLGVDDIEKDISGFRKACGSDTATYRRFVSGFRTALSVDSGKDLQNDIYTRYINMSDRL